MNGRFDSGTPPVKVGDAVDVKIEAVGSKGDGIAKIKGFVLFVPGVNEGDEVKIKITRVLRKVGFAEVVGQASGPVAEEAPAEETATQEELAEASEEAEPAEDVQDSEDFGEDLEKKE